MEQPYKEHYISNLSRGTIRQAVVKPLDYYRCLIDATSINPLWPGLAETYGLPLTGDNVHETHTDLIDSIDPMTVALYVLDTTGEPDPFPYGLTHHLHPDLHLDDRLVDLLAGRELLHVDPESVKTARRMFVVTHALQRHGELFVLNNRSILDGNLEIDVVLPRRAVGIEISPPVTHHSNRYRFRNLPRAKADTYHLDKYTSARDNGWSLIQLFGRHLSNDYIDDHLIDLVDNADKRRNVEHTNSTCPTAQGHALKWVKGQFGKMVNKAAKQAHHKVLARDAIGNVVGFAAYDHAQSTDHQDGKVAEIFGLAVDPEHRYDFLNRIRRHARSQGYTAIIYVSDNAIEPYPRMEGANFTLIEHVQPRMFYTAPDQWKDYYTSSPDDSNSEIDQVIERDMPRHCHETDHKWYRDGKFNAQAYIEWELTHRDGNNHGYLTHFDAGGQMFMAGTS